MSAISSQPPGAPREEPALSVVYSSHTHKFTGYMDKVARWFAGEAAAGRRLRILDIPAGAGQLSDALRAQGHDVVASDVNQARPEFIAIDMNQDFPFDDGSFDAVVCLEGIEHMVDPLHLVRELARVAKVGGVVVLSTPNILNFYSRLQFLFTGTFYQFHPAQLREIERNELADRFHISPVDYHRLRYMLAWNGAEIELVMGDRWKRKALLPLYALLWILGWPWSRLLFFGRTARREHAARNREMYRHINTPALLFGRSMVVVARKRIPHSDLKA